MKTLPAAFTLLLQPGEAVSLKSNRGHLLAVAAGSKPTLWLTRQGDSCDYWLGGDDTFTLQAGDAITLSVEGGADPVALTLTALAPATGAAKRQPIHGLMRLAAAARKVAQSGRAVAMESGRGACPGCTGQ